MINFKDHHLFTFNFISDIIRYNGNDKLYNWQYRIHNKIYNNFYCFKSIVLENNKHRIKIDITIQKVNT